MSGRGLCDGLITRPEESYRLWHVVLCVQETSKNEEAKTRYRGVKIQPQWVVMPGKKTTNIYGRRSLGNWEAVAQEGLMRHAYTDIHNYT